MLLVKWLAWTDHLHWLMVMVACLPLGLAPFAPPHIYEKLMMLKNGELKKAIDWFDLLFHGTPWMIAILKLVRTFNRS